MSRTGFFPFILLSTFIHVVGALAAVLLPAPSSLPAGSGLNKRKPVRVRIQTSVPAPPSAVKSAAVKESEDQKSPPLQPSVSRSAGVPATEKKSPSVETISIVRPPPPPSPPVKLSARAETRRVFEKKISIETPPSVGGAHPGETNPGLPPAGPAARPDLASLPSAPNPLPGTRPEKITRPALRTPPPPLLEKADPPVRPIVGKNSEKLDRIAGSGIPKVESPVKAPPPPRKSPALAASKSKRSGRAVPRKRVAAVRKSGGHARSGRRLAPNKAATPRRKKAVRIRPKQARSRRAPAKIQARSAVAPTRLRRPIKRPDPPPREIVASVKVDNFVRLSPKPKIRRSKPKTLRGLLSSVRSRPFDAAASPRKKHPRSRKKARLAPLLTQDVRYRGYRYAIWKKIDERLYFPEAAATGKVRGKVVVRFEVTRDGRLATLKLLRSSGFPLFDEEAMMAIRKSAPFPKFPPTIKLNRLAIKSEILYEP